MKEYILCAAIWFADKSKILYPHQPKGIDFGFVMCGHRHSSIFPQFGMLAHNRREAGIYEIEQGFLTNTNKFVTREEAAQIAFDAGQTNELLTKLFSENLY